MTIKTEDPEEVKRKEKEEILCKIQDILKEYRGEEANIPISNEYWVLLNRYRVK